jgi:hypothetical protein
MRVYGDSFLLCFSNELLIGRGGVNDFSILENGNGNGNGK